METFHNSENSLQNLCYSRKLILLYLFVYNMKLWSIVSFCKCCEGVDACSTNFLYIVKKTAFSKLCFRSCCSVSGSSGSSLHYYRLFLFLLTR